MSPKQKMSPAQYAAHAKRLKLPYKGKQAVQYRIKNKLPLKGVVLRQVILGRNVLTVNLDLLGAKTVKK